MESAWDGKRRFRLGATLPEAYRVWAERIARPPTVSTVEELLDRYALQVVPAKAPKTRGENQRQIPRLRAVFGKMTLTDFKPQHVYRYVDLRSVKNVNAAGKSSGGRTVALREIEVLSHAFTKAVEWGYIDRHPFKNEVRLQSTKPRDRYVEDWEVVACLGLKSRRNHGSILAIQAYIRIKLLTGMSRGDLLRLQPARQFLDDGIHIQRHKTRGSSGKRTIYEWTPELEDAVALAKAARPVDISPYLFCNRKGEPYFDESTGEAHGWESMWQRFMRRVFTETEVRERFTEHDLRAKAASDASSLEHARALLSHADSRVTDRVYRRRPERVKPLK
jgi:integrase